MQLSIHNLTFSYEGGYTPVFENLSLNLDTGWRLGLVGRNGRGKTTLLRLLLGELDSRGAISVSERAAYIGRVRRLARMCAKAYVEQREQLGFPLLKGGKA